jgi:hypothetical protein
MYNGSIFAQDGVQMPPPLKGQWTFGFWKGPEFSGPAELLWAHPRKALLRVVSCYSSFYDLVTCDAFLPTFYRIVTFILIHFQVTTVWTGDSTTAIAREQLCCCFPGNEGTHSNGRDVSCAIRAYELKADTCLLKLQRLQNVLRTIGNFPRCTQVHDLHTALKLPYVYDYITQLHRQQTEVI